MKLTKEQLIAENATLKAELEETNKDFADFGDVARRNLAKTLGIVISFSGQYGTTIEKLPEWSEIYARIGELRTLARQKDDSERLNWVENQLRQHLEESYKTEPG